MISYQSKVSQNGQNFAGRICLFLQVLIAGKGKLGRENYSISLIIKFIFVYIKVFSGKNIIMELFEGVYETLISKAIQEKLDNDFGEDKYQVVKNAIDSAESNIMLSSYLAEVTSSVLKEYFKDSTSDLTISKQVDCINRVLKFIEDEWEIPLDEDMLSEESQNKFLRAIYSKVGLNANQIASKSQNHPISGYRVSSLFTGGKDLSLDDEIRRDIDTADQIDLVVSFIRWTGLRLIIENLRDFLQKPNAKLRVITTTYMGATDPKAIKELFSLSSPDKVQIKVSYNTREERLHAKSYIFKRDTNFDTAYIGSSNLSYSALTKGLEWNMRVTNVENPHILDKTKAAFDTYWNSEDFELIKTEDDVRRFAKAIEEVKGLGSVEARPIIRFERKTHQIKVLEKLKFERQQGHYKNLIIAATGTGKTAISAFDYKDFNEEFKKKHGRDARLLFIAHRDKILQQARYTYSCVLVNSNFGELWVGHNRPSVYGDLNHLFISIQMLNNNVDLFSSFGKEYYDYIVIDEAHHGTAASYQIIYQLFHPQILLGLTATPERMDGKEVRTEFDNRYAAEIRLYEAIDQQLLSPFDYFCVKDDDSVNLSKIVCRGDRYDVVELNRKYCTQTRFNIIYEALCKYITDPYRCKAVCFCCSIEHAEFMADGLSRYFNAKALTSRNRDKLQEYTELLGRGEINYLCVADILNEGIDIPEIDTVLFLRPTESLTVFLQQLGRGLRLADGKDVLTVLDFVAQANQSYNYESRFRALMGKTKTPVAESIKKGFVFLPRGCSITMEKRAQEYILQNIRDSIFNLRRLKREVSTFTSTTGLDLTLPNFLDYFSLDWELIYKSPGSWTELKVEAGKAMPGYERTPFVINIEKGLVRLWHTNSLEYINYISDLIENKFVADVSSRRKCNFLRMFYYTIFYVNVSKLNKKYGKHYSSEVAAVRSLNNYPYFIEELSDLIDIKRSELSQCTEWLDLGNGKEIELYGCYSKDEVDILVKGEVAKETITGTHYCVEEKIAIVYVTINKSDEEYSPSTLYQDYVINKDQFHWQSQNNVRAESVAGQRFIHQSENGWKFLLLVRDSKKDNYGATNGYYCLGLMNFESYHGECPMNIVWNMQKAIPGFMIEMAKVI